jgi:hypothetical protein
MDIKQRTSLAAAGGVLCAAVGSLLGGIVVVVVRAAQGSGENVAQALTFLPLAMIFAAIPAAPFGFLVGSVGTWWLSARVDRGFLGDVSILSRPELVHCSVLHFPSL